MTASSGLDPDEEEAAASAETRAMVAAAGKDPKQKRLSWSGNTLVARQKDSSSTSSTGTSTSTTTIEAPTQHTQRTMKQSATAVFRHMCLNVGVNTIVVGTRPALLLWLLKGDAGKATRMQAWWAGLIGFLEFFVNPALGRLSDKVGRKPFLMLGPVVNFFLKALVAFRPSVRTLMLERIVCGAMTTVAGSTTCSAVLSDLSTGKGLAMKGANLGAMAGLGCVVGPLIGGQLLARTGSFRLPFLVAAAFAAVDLAMLQGNFQETLAESKPFDWAAVNPLRFLKLFDGTSTAFKTLLVVSGLLCFPEGKNLSDLNQMYILKHAKLSPDMRTLFTVGFGCTMFLGGHLAKVTLQKFGQRGHTTLANAATMLGLSIWSMPGAKAAAMFLGLAVLTAGMERRAATNALTTKLALEAGFSRGEYAGLFANWRAIITSVAPVLYGKVYSMFSGGGGGGSGSGWPGAPYVVAGLVCLMGEAGLRGLKDGEIGLVEE